MNTAIAVRKTAEKKADSFPPVENKEKVGLVERLMIKAKAKKIANQTLRSLNEVKKIEAGKKKAKSFDEFLDEL